METTLLYDIKINDKKLHDQLKEYIDWRNICDEIGEAHSYYNHYYDEVDPIEEYEFPELSFDEKDFLKRLEDRFGIKDKSKIKEKEFIYPITGAESITQTYNDRGASVKFKPNENEEVECFIYGHNGDTDDCIVFERIGLFLKGPLSIREKLDKLRSNRRSTVYDVAGNRKNKSEEEYEKDKKNIEQSILKSIELATIDEKHYNYIVISDVLYEVQRLYEIEYLDDSLYKQLMSEILKKLKDQRFYISSCIYYG